MKKLLLSFLMLVCISGTVRSQKNVAAVINFTGANAIDSVTINKGKSFVVQLPVRNRAGDDWKLAFPPAKCNFTQSMLGQVGMLPNQPEPKLMFFKATEKGQDSIRFVYKNPKAPEGTAPEEKLLRVTIQ